MRRYQKKCNIVDIVLDNEIQITSQFSRMDFNHRSPNIQQNGNNYSSIQQRSENKNQSILNTTTTCKPPKQQMHNINDVHDRHQHNIYHQKNLSHIQKSRQSHYIDRRRARSECLSPSRNSNYYQATTKSSNVKGNNLEPIHRFSRNVYNDESSNYNRSQAWRQRYRANSESASDYYIFRNNFPEIEDYKNNKRTREPSLTPPEKSNNFIQQHRVTNKTSFSVLVNTPIPQNRYSPKLKARSHFLNSKSGSVFVSSSLHKKRIEVWKSQSNSNSIPSLDSSSTYQSSKQNNEADDDDDDDDLEEEEDPPGPEDCGDIEENELTDPEDNYELSLSLSYSERSLSSLSTINSSCVQGGKVLSAPFAQSLFPFVPPYITFATFEEKGPEMPAVIHKQLKWKLTTITPLLVRKILINTGWRLMKKPNDYCGTWAKHMKSSCFKTLHSYQKFNHLPGSFQIGRKDRCWRNLQVLMTRHGKKEFGFMPRTYIIPQDLNLLRQSWHKFSQKNTKWIIKPPASARGTGIRVISGWSQIPKKKPLIVQRYIERPLLINGSKFDLRLYILVTSMNPLRVFLHTDGLARFASVKYSERLDTLNDRYMHLTNYSINKFSNSYDKNDDASACKGMKWTIKSLWNYLEERGVNTVKLWGALRNLVLKTVIAGEGSINSMIKSNLQSKYNSFELFGIDVILDSELVPWLLEVNISPSLHSASGLDMAVKGPLVTALLNTVMYQIPPKIPLAQQAELARELNLKAPLCYDKRIFVTALSKEERLKHQQFAQKGILREDYLNAILDNLTPDDVRCLILSEDELARSHPLERIFPAPNSHRYLQFTEQPRYYNLLLDAWENRYAKKRDAGISLLRSLCWKRIHLKVPPSSMQKDCDNNEAMEKIVETESSEESSTLTTITMSSTSNSSTSPESIDRVAIQPNFINSNENKDTSNVAAENDLTSTAKKSPSNHDCFSTIVNCFPSITSDSEIIVRQ